MSEARRTHEPSSAAHREVFSRAACLLGASTDFRESLEHTLLGCLAALGDFGFFDVREDADAITTSGERTN